MALRVHEGGSGTDLLMLLHGLGATGGVWRDVDEHWRGRWVAPDLPGHGGSDPLPAYTFDAMAAELVGLIGPDDTVVLLGHSLGGVLGLVLAARATQVRHVVGLGIKVFWSEDELAKAGELSQRPVSWLDTRDEALNRHRRISGLGELVSDGTAAEGVREVDGRWRLALDPRAFGVGAPDMRRLLDECPAPVTLARGERDPMVSREQLAALTPDAVELTGLGHNAHLEDPPAVYALV